MIEGNGNNYALLSSGVFYALEPSCDFIKYNSYIKDVCTDVSYMSERHCSIVKKFGKGIVWWISNDLPAQTIQLIGNLSQFCKPFPLQASYATKHSLKADYFQSIKFLKKEAKSEFWRL